MTYRIEHDTMGEVKVPAEHLWGAQTQRSLNNFKIGGEKMPLKLIHGFAQLKKACTLANRHFGKLEQDVTDTIVRACDEILSGKHDREFPLSVWQTGSGTQTNMNLNEVIAHLANRSMGSDTAGEARIHPNDHVNMSQSSNDTFPTAMHIAAVQDIESNLLPALSLLTQTLDEKTKAFKDIVKIGRTHLQDATPLTLGQEVSGWAAMLKNSHAQIEQSLEPLRFLAIGGTAVGTGLNAPAALETRSVNCLRKQPGPRFIPPRINSTD